MACFLTRTNEWSVIEPYSAYGPLATWHRIDSPNIYSSYIDHYSGYYRSLEYLQQQGYQKSVMSSVIPKI